MVKEVTVKEVKILKEVKIVKEAKKVIACDVSPVAMLCFCTFPYHSSQNIPKLGFMNCTISSFEFLLWEILFDNLMIATL